ncbi:bifunctional diguanylate cyclase/phosphodiesterase [Aliikangiella sp. G2MR2-5]|uniref:putative bifunctional diguanylate cyclase/phosphodiesterase n=1 Tax=Aliikangiella sp. G2MR2-5 TaxID=2788943 RepID=UPI0018AC8800|nr:GGDEF domain-containing phosphodiesterase [Aliikangiella sp. G2MR2-5]
MKLKDNLTLIHFPILASLALIHAAGVYIYLSYAPEISEALDANNSLSANAEWVIVALSAGVSFLMMSLLVILVRARIQAKLIVKLDYLNHFIRDIGKAEPMPINGIIPETDEIDRLVESVLVMRNNYAIQKKSLEKLAYYDKLTGLPNRDYLVKELNRVIQIARRKKEVIAVLHLDLDEFEKINSHIGRDAGDTLLTLVGERLEKVVRGSDLVQRKGHEKVDQKMLVARTTGAEFSLLLVDIEQPENALKVARRLLDALSVAFVVEEHRILLDACIGISVFPSDGKDAEILLKNADFAVNEASRRGKSEIAYFEKEMNTHALDKFQMEKELRRALDHNELSVQFQPRVSLSDGDVVAFEALVRWQKPGSQLIPAAEFMPVAEETNLICEIGNWVFDRVCRQVQLWREKGYNYLRASINLSEAQLYNSETIDLLKSYMSLYDIPGSSLEVEVTERAILKDIDKAIEVLRQYCTLDITVSLDDFGSDYSSITLLQNLPLDVLKIDRRFICDELNNQNGQKLLKSIITIANNFGLYTVACGVEKQEQVNFFKDAECNFIQGHYFAHPVDADKVTSFLESWMAELTE